MRRAGGVKRCTAGNGRLAAQHLLRWAADQRCPDPAAFTEAVQALFRTWCNVHAHEGIDLDVVSGHGFDECVE